MLAWHLTRSYRQTVGEKALCGPWGCVKNASPSIRRRIKEDRVDFSYEGLLEAYETEPPGTDLFSFATGNRCKWKDPRDIFEWTWTDRPIGQWASRKNMENLPFRHHFREVMCGLGGLVNDNLAEEGVLKEFSGVFWARFWEWHWVVPLPESGGSLASCGDSKRGEAGVRKWLSYYPGKHVRWTGAGKAMPGRTGRPINLHALSSADLEETVQEALKECEALNECGHHNG